MCITIMKKRDENRDVWRIGELADATGVSTDTLRHYERKGLLRPRRSSNGYREYPGHAIERVRTIRQALAVGFTLEELTTVFKVFDGGGAPCHEVRELAATKLGEIERHLKEVTTMRDELRDALADWDARLAKTARGQRAGLLKALAARETVKRSSNTLLLRKPKVKKGRKND
jgi:DNA-binding transcriptional MerR regulator